MNGILVMLWLAQLPSPRLIEVRSRVPGAETELRYATKDNFMGRAVYPASARCFLREPVAMRLRRVAERLRGDGYRVRLYDCYRPHRVQVEMWRIFPKPGYVADPKLGSNHNRGAAVDVTLVTADGFAVPMPSPYDHFGKEAHHDFEGAGADEKKNRERLLEAMRAEGFRPNPMEWWHYDAPDAARYAVLDVPFEALAASSSAASSSRVTRGAGAR